jgi:very-short-patch-repair endonuclease
MHGDDWREFRAVLLQRAREMRKDPAPAEQKLWKLLRNRQLNGLKFRRQQRVGKYIADFLCFETQLIVELDGESHGGRDAYDARRTLRLERDGCRVIRFHNGDVFWHTDSVLEEILRECESRTPPHPGPLPKGEGGR